VTAYERVAYRPEGSPRQRSVVLIDPTEDALSGTPVLTGYESDREGVALDRIHVIDLSLVTHRTRLRVNPHYGTLEEAK
jgi:hypothetical protein